MTQASDVSVRRMMPQDINYVAFIEREMFDIPWTIPEFASMFDAGNIRCLVAEWHDIIIGYIIAEKRQNSLHILNLAVVTDWQRRGVGRRLVGRVRTMLNGVTSRITLEVRETNLPAQVFFRKLGFLACNIMSDFYDDCEEDAYVFQYQRPRQLTAPANRFSVVTSDS